jgi:hypothetical protein
MNIEILDGCRDASFRELGGIARGVALFDAPHGKFIAGAEPPINSSSVLALPGLLSGVPASQFHASSVQAVRSPRPIRFAVRRCAQ